jgi:hypothetical protein
MSACSRAALPACFLHCPTVAVAAAAWFLCLPSISAIGQQITLKPDGKTPSILQTRAVRDPHRRYPQWFEQVENRSANPIVALALRYNCKTHPLNWPAMDPPGAAAGSNGTGMVLSEPPDLPATFPDGNGMEIFDSLSALHPKFSIPPGSNSRLRFGTIPQAFDCSVRVNTVLFAGGSDEGDRRDLLRIYRQRQGTYEALAKSIPVAEAVAGGRMDVPAAAKALFRFQRSLQSAPGGAAADYGDESVAVPLPDSGWYTPSERAGANQVYNAVRLALISERGAARFPWKVASAQEPGTNVPAPSSNSIQARAALLVAEMRAWRAVLDGHLKPVKGK